MRNPNNYLSVPNLGIIKHLGQLLTEPVCEHEKASLFAVQAVFAHLGNGLIMKKSCQRYSLPVWVGFHSLHWFPFTSIKHVD